MIKYFSDDETAMLSNGILALIKGAGEAKQLIEDPNIKNSISLYIEDLQLLNNKLCTAEPINEAGVSWCNEDIETALQDSGIEVSQENIDKVATPEFVRSLQETLSQAGNEAISYRVDEVF